MVVKVMHVLFMFVHECRHIGELHVQVHHLQKSPKQMAAVRTLFGSHPYGYLLIYYTQDLTEGLLKD